MTNFKDLQLIPPILKAVKEAGYNVPSPIQKKAIPPVLAGRDLLGCAQTGTGKTAAFALPILQLLSAQGAGGGNKGKRPIRSLILTPTRELALQIYESFGAYGKHLPALRCAVIFGGVGQAPQVEQLRRGVDILVATPGRLNDLIGQGFIKLDSLEIFVLDEADRMLDMGFINDVRKVIRLLPQKRQTLLFSATMPDEIVKLADSLLHQPTKVFVTPASTTVEAIEQKLYKVDKGNKKHLLAQLLRQPDTSSTLVFTRTKHGADRVVKELSRAGITAAAIHGNKSQNARQSALARFKNGDVGVLVATDIAARGLDINELSHVINYDLPNIPETYVHRIGRTGRAGRDGIAYSFCAADEVPYLEDIEKLIGFSIGEERHDWPSTGEAAPEKKPAGREPRAKEPAKKQQPKAPKRAPEAAKPPRAANAQAKPQPAPKKTEKPARGQKPSAAKKGRGTPFDPYENLTGGKAIITKRPVWSTGDAPASPQNEGDTDMSRNRKRRGNRGRGKQGTPEEQQGAAKEASPAKQQSNEKKKAPAIPKNENGVFDFSEAELSEDTGIKVVSRSDNTATKFASFEDYLKNQ